MAEAAAMIFGEMVSNKSKRALYPRDHGSSSGATSGQSPSYSDFSFLNYKMQPLTCLAPKVYEDE